MPRTATDTTIMKKPIMAVTGTSTGTGANTGETTSMGIAATAANPVTLLMEEVMEVMVMEVLMVVMDTVVMDTVVMVAMDTVVMDTAPEAMPDMAQVTEGVMAVMGTSVAQKSNNLENLAQKIKNNINKRHHSSMQHENK